MFPLFEWFSDWLASTAWHRIFKQRISVPYRIAVYDSGMNLTLCSAELVKRLFFAKGQSHRN
jgi:hypothetical protein